MNRNKEDYLVVRESTWVLRFRGLFLVGLSGVLAIQLRNDPGNRAFLWTVIMVFAVGGIATMLRTLNPPTRLVLDATGIWATGYDTVEWQQLASFYSTEYTGTEETTPYLVFTTLTSQELRVNMDAVDTDFDTIRQGIKRLNTNTLLRDYGQR